MTRVQTLQSEIETLESQSESIRSQRWELEDAFNEKLTTEVSRFFRGVVCEDIVVTASSRSISFKMLVENDYLKEIFQIYLREDYSVKREIPYIGIDLSYYTTEARSDFELIRLENLGRVASVIRKMSNEILQKVNTLAIEFTNEIKEKNFYKQISELEDQINALRSQIREIKREEVKAKVFSEEGLSFEKARGIQMKFNFTPIITNIKLVDMNAKGTRAKAIFTFSQGDYVSSEENVNVQKILGQVL